MSCWVCGDATAYTDQFDVQWCDEHLNIHTQAWLEAIERSADDPSL